MAWRKPSNLRDWLRIIFRHKKKFFFPAVAAMILVMWASRYIPREYRADGVFQRLNDAALEELGSSATRRNVGQIRQTLQEELRGRGAIEQLIEDLQLTRDLPHTPDGELTAQGQLQKLDQVNRIRGRIGVGFRIRSPQLDQISVSFITTDREMAPKVVNQLVENYIRKTRQQLDAMLLNAKTFFEREVTRYRTRIADLEQKKLRFELEHPGMTPNDPTAVQSQLISLRAKLAETADQLELSKSKRDSLTHWLKEQPDFMVQDLKMENPERTELIKRKSALEQELDTRKQIMRQTDKHPAVINLRELIALLTKKISETDAIVEAKGEAQPNVPKIQGQRDLESMAAEIKTLETRRGELARQVEQYDTLQRNFFVVRNEYLKLERELKESQSQVTFWENNLRRTVISLTAEIGQRGVRLSFIQRAPDVARPSSPTVRKIAMGAAVVGIGIGLFMIFLAELLDHSFHSIEHAVDDLKLPVLGAVNEIITPSETFRRKILGWGVYPVVVVAMLVILCASFILVYLSLQQPLMYEQLVNRPGQFVRQHLLG